MKNTEELAKKVEAILKEKAENEDAARNAVAFLFPKLANDLKVYLTATGDERLKGLRIENKDSASLYFRLNPANAHWHRDELEKFFSDPNPFQSLSNVEERISAERKPENRFKLRRTFLEYIIAAFRDKHAHFNAIWLNALVAYSPAYIKAPNELAGSMFSVDFITQLEWVVMMGLRQMPTDTGIDAFKSAIKEAKDISILCDTFRGIAGDLNSEGAQERNNHSLDFGEEEAATRELLLARVRDLAEEKTLLQQASPDRILWFWWGANHREEVIRFTTREMSTQEGTRCLMEMAISLVRSTSENYERVPKETNRIVDLVLLKERAEVLLQRSENPGDKILAKRFPDALERKDFFG